MCGRFYIPEDDSSEELQRIIDHLNRKKATPVKTGEVRPTDVAAVIANSKSLQPTPFAMKWGYSLADHRPLINARSETAEAKPLFRDGMQQRRCLIPASHYFEWQKLANKKIKNAIKPVNSTAMYMAGLYRFQNGVPEFIILTREPGDSIRHIHDRMPVILPREALKDWMNLNYNAAEVMRSAMLNMAFEAEMPIFGGALFMCGQVATVFITTYFGPAKGYLSKAARGWRIALLSVLLLMNLCLLVLYPIAFDSPRMWLLLVLVVLMLARDEGCRWLVQQEQQGMLTGRRMWIAMTVLQGSLLLVMTGTLLYNVGGVQAWQMLGGYALCSAMECYGLLRERESIRPITAAKDEQAQQAGDRARKANAYTAYENLAMLIEAALVMTMVVLYTFLAVTAEDLLRCMILAVGSMLVFRELAEQLLRWREKRRLMDPTNLLLLGLVLWIYGLTLFSDMLKEGTMSMNRVYVHLGLCSAGVTLCLTCLSRMEPAMVQVIKFASAGQAAGYDDLRASQKRLAVLLGEMLALAALTVLCFVTGKDLPRDAAQIAARFQPVMVVPALLIVIAAGLAVLRFPLTTRWMDKLGRFLRLKEAGGENPALEKQLESVVVKPHRQPFGTRILIALLRPFFRHELKGTENIVPDENNPIVFLGNHGEIYGPVVCMLYIPVPIRPWVMSELNIHKDEVAAYVYKHTISKITWLGPLRWPVAKMIGPVSVWCMNQLESIPVFRNKPRELMNTFRTSVEAMQAGDNLLIFPENPDADREHPGYEHEKGGMGELFRGFAMLAPVYYNRTGKRCRFLPMYAHKGLRTISFGTEIVYDPDNDPMKERDRIVDGAYGQMLGMAAREEALYQQRRAHNARDAEM